MKLYFNLLLLILFALTACEDEVLTNDEQAQRDDELIQAYIADNNLQNVVKTESGLYYLITDKPSDLGSFPTPTSIVTVSYRGTLLDGTEFDQNDSFETSVSGGVIRGWQEGLQFFKKTWKGLLIIPSALAYGRSARGVIPANAVLVFEMEMLDFQ